MLRRPLALLLLSVLLAAADLPTPQRVYDQAMGNSLLKTSSGEQFTWNAAYRAHTFIEGYLASGKDAAWLEMAQRYYDWCIEQGVSNDPDGYPGTIGADIFDPQGKQATVTDTVVGDANLAWPLLEFAGLVRADPALQARFGVRADAYIALATRMCWEKWNRRGCYQQDSLGFGSYRTYERAIDRADRSKWVPRPDPISDNLNKHYKAGMVFLHLWRLTGKAEYRDRVVAIFSRAKAMFRLLPDEDRIVWNFWMPHRAYDMAGTSPRSWVGVHPERPAYQAFEAGAFLDVYDAGLVFDRQDIERIVRTNRWMIANGLKSADGTSKAGMVWDALSGLDPAIRAAAGSKDPLHAAYLDGLVAQRTGYARLHAAEQDALVSRVAVQPGRRICAALAIPEVIELANADRIRLLARVMEAGTLTIELLSADGATVLGELHREAVDPKQGAFICPRWNGSNPATGRAEPGRFLVRWTLNGESRTWPVVVIQGTAQEKKAGPQPLVAGDRLAYDFEQPLDERWTLTGATLSAEEKAQGAQALRIGSGQSAILHFGDQDDLPVRITFAAFDGGARKGKTSATGQALCLQTADGNLFAMRQVWRGYLNGDGEWYWMNNGENQWFSPHASGVKRATGWNRWTIDCRDPAALVVERDGARVDAKRLQPLRFVPATGGVALAFLGPAEAGDPPLRIDDLVIELPAKP
jgi:hypothetical protein